MHNSVQLRVDATRRHDWHAVLRQRSDVRYATASASIRRDSEAERTTRNARPIDRYIFQMYFGIISLYEVKFVTVKKRLIAPASRRFERLRYTPQHPQ